MAASIESGELNLMFGDKFLMVLHWWGGRREGKTR